MSTGDGKGQIIVSRKDASRQIGKWGAEGPGLSDVMENYYCRNEFGPADTGTLCRIADALESIADSLKYLDPNWRRKIEASYKHGAILSRQFAAEREERRSVVGPMFAQWRTIHRVELEGLPQRLGKLVRDGVCVWEGYLIDYSSLYETEPWREILDLDLAAFPFDMFDGIGVKTADKIKECLETHWAEEDGSRKLDEEGSE